MNEFIRIIKPDLFLLSTELLGLPKAQLWIGSRPDGPMDNEDERVLRERAVEAAKKQEPSHRISGIEAVDLLESEQWLGWYEVRTNSWMPGIYRFNIHSHARVQAPNGTPLDARRDHQYSWPVFTDDVLIGLPDAQQQFLYLERNNAGFCMRIEIASDRSIKPAGDGLEWVSRWPEIKKNII